MENKPAASEIAAIRARRKKYKHPPFVVDEFVAHAPTDIDTLLAAVEAQAATIRTLRSQLLEAGDAIENARLVLNTVAPSTLRDAVDEPFHRFFYALGKGKLVDQIIAALAASADAQETKP